MNKKIVIIGGGYGGTETLRQLILRKVENIEIELITNKKYFENIIGCAEIISEKIKVEELVYDLKNASGQWDFELTVGNVESIDLNRKKLKVDGKEKTYDVLVVAVGAKPNFFNVIGANLALPAHTLTDFINIHEKLTQLDLENPHIVVVGAGFVGLEIVAELLDFFKIKNRNGKVTVVDKMNSIMPMYNNDLARKIAHEYFISRGTNFLLGKGVKEIEKERCILEDGSTVEADITIWAAGVQSPEITSKIIGANLYKGYIEVDKRLLINGSADSFAIGDAAFIKINGTIAQKMAAEALEEAKTVAKNIGLIAYGHKPSFTHVIRYTTDFPKAILSIGEDKAILIGSEIPSYLEAAPNILHRLIYMPGIDRIIDAFSKVISGPKYASMGTMEYLLKKKIVTEEIMGRLP